jgi:GT2 family glycosyltransferase
VADFERLIAEFDVAAAWLGLLAARRLQGAHDLAAEALQQLLRRHCVPEDPGFAEVASAVAAAAGRPGWCGIEAGGILNFAATGELTGFADGAPFAVSPGAAAPQARAITLHGGEKPLLGCPLNPLALQHCEGLVEAAGAALTGWVSRPAAPLRGAKLFLLDAKGQRRKIPIGEVLPAAAQTPLTPRFAFHCPVSMLLDLTPPFRVIGPDGADIFGSPIDPGTALTATPISADYLGPANQLLPERAELRVVVPVYRGLAVTQACLRAALQALPVTARLIVVDDASPEPELQSWLDIFCQDPRIDLIRHGRNLGFPAAANAGMAAAAGCDVLLLNSDSLLPAQALRTLLSAVYSSAEIGSATPLSNEATICSYPGREGGNAAPDFEQTLALDAMAHRCNGTETVEIPTGVGFCLLMRHDCIARTGRLAECFAQGYGEEVDWCQRARHRGYRHVAAAGAYVAHLHRVSFGPAGEALNARNARLLERFYPGYEKLIAAHIKADPLAAARRRLDRTRFAAGRCESAVLLISHSHGGGVARRIATEMQEIRALGQRPILLCPAAPGEPAQPFPYAAQLSDGVADYPNLRFELPEQMPELLEMLRAEAVERVVLHHGLGHHPSLRNIAAALGCPQDIVVHDYASFCPRVHLIGLENRYCGEPELLSCTACVTAAGDATAEGLGPENLRARSAQEFAGARRVIAPSADASRRIARHFPDITPEVTPWEDDTRPLRLTPPGRGRRRIAILGGIGLAKGYDILLACAEDARTRQLPLEFVIAGASFDDETLLQTGRIFITGPYEPDELPALLRDLKADLAFIPSIWPETWCFTLSEAWQAGLYTIAFDLGAQAERIRATKRGRVLPLGLPASRINDSLLSWNP